MRNTLMFVCLLLLGQLCCAAQTAATKEGRDQNRLGMAGTPSNQPDFVPMTQAERFRRLVKSTFSPESLLMGAAGAGITQWEHSPKEWPEGAEGYAMRFGNSYAQRIIRHTLEYGASSLLHEDNRYFRSGKSGLGPRLKYAVASTFLARRDDGTRCLSFSRIGGTAGTAVISRQWQPRSTNTMGDATASFGISMGMQIGFNVAREFWPGILHRQARDRRTR